MLAVRICGGGHRASSVPRGLRLVHVRDTELWRLQSTKGERLGQWLCVTRVSSRKPYLSGVLRPHDNHSTFLPRGRPVFLVQNRLRGI